MKAYFTLVLGIVLLYGCQESRSGDPKPGITEKVIEQFENGNPRIVKFYQEGSLNLVKQVFYYENGNIQQEGEFENGERHGDWKSYYSNGEDWSLNTYEHGILNGPYKTWYQNGQLRIDGHYTDGKASGKWEYFDQNGKTLKEENK